MKPYFRAFYPLQTQGVQAVKWEKGFDPLPGFESFSDGSHFVPIKHGPTISLLEHGDWLIVRESGYEVLSDEEFFQIYMRDIDYFPEYKTLDPKESA